MAREPVVKRYEEIPPIYECAQFKPNRAKDLSTLTEWLVRNGHPWLLGDPELPEEMKPADEEKDGPGDHGIYIEPNTGHLVIRSGNRDHFVEPNDWIVLHPNGAIGIFENDLFPKRFKEI